MSREVWDIPTTSPLFPLAHPLPSFLTQSESQDTISIYNINQLIKSQLKGDLLHVLHTRVSCSWNNFLIIHGGQFLWIDNCLKVLGM